MDTVAFGNTLKGVALGLVCLLVLIESIATLYVALRHLELIREHLGFSLLCGMMLCIILLIPADSMGLFIFYAVELIILYASLIVHLITLIKSKVCSEIEDKDIAITKDNSEHTKS